MFRKKKKKQPNFNTSRESWERIGIHLTKEQYQDLCVINQLMVGDIMHGTCTPVHYIMLVLKTLGLLPSELPDQISDNEGYENFKKNPDDWFKKKFGDTKKISEF